ncbi:hypothetical protein SBOR_3638 [Sclerotinia borealis F-4128]|uniref:Uncharacterized protein n=1 Tax=Sclerotinia borealis (strain F-4128) TaxID=1432307 RepID=W9CJA8_SCLBF|nr:hypothetical protein SBOR_3638 [Sclerotinia borealis F-4128]
MSRLASLESMNDIAMAVDTLLIEGPEEFDAKDDTMDWQTLYFRSRQVITKLRSGHRYERNGLIMENLSIRRDTKLLRAVFSKLQRNSSRVLAQELYRDNAECSTHVKILAASVKDLSLQVSRKNEAEIKKRRLENDLRVLKEDMNKMTTEHRGTIITLKEESRALENKLLRSSLKIKDLDHALEVYSEVAENIMNRKREWSKPPRQRDSRIIEQGNRVAHGGTCLADAYRIMSTSNNCSGWFKEYYGITPETVIALETSDAFKKLLDMRYEVYRYRNDVGTPTRGFEEGFQKLLKAVLVDTSAAAESVQKLLVGDNKTELGSIYQSICITWNAATTVSNLHEKEAF